MTLLVSGITNEVAWMVADAAITDPLLREGEAHLSPKIFELRDAIVGYAGDPLTAAQAIAALRQAPLHGERLEILVRAGVQGAADFAYAYVSDGQPRLCRIRAGKCQAMSTFHLGSPHGFRRFSTRSA